MAISDACNLPYSLYRLGSVRTCTLGFLNHKQHLVYIVSIRDILKEYWLIRLYVPLLQHNHLLSLSGDCLDLHLPACLHTEAKKVSDC